MDATRKVKSVLLYNAVPGGVLVRHITGAFNTMVPTYAAALVNNLASFGAREGWQTAVLTKEHMPRVARDFNSSGGQGDT